jgi:type II secretory pathway pseudopilin PulG
MSALRTKSRRPSRARAGFTLVEVMIAGSVFVIGMVGLTYMQTASVRSNQDAYESMVATHFAKQWIDRIKRDALYWTAPGAPTPAAWFGARTSIKSTSYFDPNPGPLDGTGLWPLDANESTGINYHGFEVGQTDPMLGRVDNGQIYYCAAARFYNGTNNQDGLLATMTARVAVWWTRKSSLELTLRNNAYSYITAARAGGCQAANLDFDPFVEAAVPPTIRRVRLATALRYTPL